MLADFYDEGIEQLQLFTDAASCSVHKATAVYRKNMALMTVLDENNHRGKAKVFFAAKDLQQDWAMKRQLLWRIRRSGLRSRRQTKSVKKLLKQGLSKKRISALPYLQTFVFS